MGGGWLTFRGGEAPSFPRSLSASSLGNPHSVLLAALPALSPDSGSSSLDGLGLIQFCDLPSPRQQQVHSKKMNTLFEAKGQLEACTTLKSVTKSRRPPILQEKMK